MKKIIIPVIIVIVAVLVGLQFYGNSKKTIINASNVTKIDVPSPSIKDPQLKYQSFTNNQSIIKFIKILNSSKPKQFDIVGKNVISSKAYPITIYNKDNSITNIQLLLSSENIGEWIIAGNDGTAISKSYIIPPKQANELYNILKDIPN